jgi:hypothetical protein
MGLYAQCYFVNMPAALIQDKALVAFPDDQRRSACFAESPRASSEWNRSGQPKKGLITQ